MRDIKFRAWIAESKTMMPWEGIQASKVLALDPSLNPNDFIVLPSVYELMQYTGLKDANGVEVYEGDIVESFVHPDIPLHHVIEWSDKYKGWFARNTNAKSEHDGSIQLFVYARNCQFNVVGNIHENPELLEIKDV